jgi:DNA-binding transcriptional ArsR family regulator
MMTTTPQTDYEATTQWFHVLKDMIDSGDLARLSGSAVKVYLVVKAHLNLHTGRAFPSRATIAEKAGLSEPQVTRELRSLEELGYITRAKVGRRNEYGLREKIEITDHAGNPAAVATWDYIPGGVRDAVADLRNVLVSGDFEGAKIVKIERLQVNVTHLHDNAVNLNVQEMVGSLDALPADLRERVMAAMTAQKASKPAS